jgi:hypothetical protein
MLAAVHLLLMFAVPALAGTVCAYVVNRIARARALRWHARPVSPADGETEVRGKIVVAGKGASGLANVAARTTYRSTARNDLAGMSVEESERARTVSIACDDGEVEIAGAIEVARGSQARWGAHIIAWTVESGDVVRAFGRVTKAAAGDVAGGSYRDAPARRKLEPITHAVRLACDAPPRQIVRMPAWRQPLCFLVTLPFLWLPLGALVDFSELGADTSNAANCRSFGSCHAIPTWRRHDTWREAVLGWWKGHHFRMGPASDADCRASQICTSDGECAVGDHGSCAAARDEDCRQSWGCAAYGSCSLVSGKCSPAKDEDCALLPVCYADGACSAVNGGCRVSKDADCAPTDGCKSYGACSAVTDPRYPSLGASCQARGADCAKTYACRSNGRCASEDGMCVVSDAGCKASYYCDALGECSEVGGQCGAARDEDCFWSDPCASLAKCRATSGGGCDADYALASRVRGVLLAGATEKSCKESLGCKDHGACTLLDERCKKSCAEDPDCTWRGQCTQKGGRCVAGSDAECRATPDCGEYGRCSAVDGLCVAGSDEGCRESYFCGAIGACTARHGECVRVSDDDCRRSVRCASKGECTLAGNSNSCQLLSDADCALTTGCAKRGECSLVGDKCAPAKDADCQQSEGCKRNGWCVAASGPPPGHDRVCFRVSDVGL